MEAISTQENEAQQRVLSFLSLRLGKKLGFKTKEEIGKAIDDFLKKNFSNEKLNGNYAWKKIEDAIRNSPIAQKEEKNEKFLVNLNYDFAKLWPTPIILKKSIADATEEIRYVFEKSNFHDYKNQEKGTSHKTIKKAFFIRGTQAVATKISLYRPETKNGDPRLWFYHMSSFCEAGDELAIICLNDIAYLLNLSKYDYTNIKDKVDLSNVGFAFLSQASPISNNALNIVEKLKNFLGVPIRNPKQHQQGLKQYDTDVGAAVEAALNISANSSKNPDLSGVELKAWRTKRKNRHTLFTQTPSWELSHFPSMREFVEKVGYKVSKKEKRDKLPPTARELRCTVNSIKPNAQNLKLAVDSEKDWVSEDLCLNSVQEHLLVWTGELLRNRLAEKHPETLWIECDTSTDSDGKEVFFIRKIYYTHQPLLSRFLPLVEEGKITLDHMCGYRKRSNDTKYTFSERGPSWKIHSKDLAFLFPEPKMVLSEEAISK
jgi:hypothetical protein